MQHSPPSTPHHARGFSLVELMIVVAIIGVLAAISVPTLGRFFERSAARDNAVTIANTIRKARTQAMNSGMAVMLQINRTGEPLMVVSQATEVRGGNPVLLRSCLQIDENSTIRPLTTIPRSAIHPDAVIEHLSATGTSDVTNNIRLCISSTGAISTIEGVPVGTEVGCSKGLIVGVAMTGKNGPLGSEELLCAANTEAAQRQLKLDRELYDYYLVEASYSGAVTVRQ